MVETDDSQNEFYDASFEFSESELSVAESAEKFNDRNRTKNKTLTCQSHRTIAICPGNSIVEKSMIGFGLIDFLEIICESILDNRLTWLFRKLTALPKFTSTNEKTITDDDNDKGSNIINVYTGKNDSVRIGGKLKEQTNIEPDSTGYNGNSVEEEDQLSIYGIDFTFSDNKRIPSNSDIEKNSKCPTNSENVNVSEIPKSDPDNLIVTDKKPCENTENASKNSLSEITNNTQYSQTSGKITEEEPELTRVPENQRPESKQMPSKNHREKKIPWAFENRGRRRSPERYVSLETIQEILIPVDEKHENDFKLDSNQQNYFSAKNATDYNFPDNYPNYPKGTDSPYKYYHRNMHAMNCQKDNEDFKMDEQCFQEKHNKTNKNKQNLQEDYNPISQLEKLLELYTSHKINQELRRHESSSDTSPDELTVDIDPKMIVELRRKSDKNHKYQSTPYLLSSSQPLKLRQNLRSERNICDSKIDDRLVSTTKKIRMKNASNDQGKDASLKKSTRSCQKKRKISSTLYYGDTYFKNHPADKNKNKQRRSTKNGKTNKIMKKLFNT